MLLHLNAAPTPPPPPRVVPVQQFERSCNSRKEFSSPHSFFRQQRRGLSLLNKGTQKGADKQATNAPSRSSLTRVRCLSTGRNRGRRYGPFLHLFQCCVFSLFSLFSNSWGGRLLLPSNSRALYSPQIWNRFLSSHSFFSSSLEKFL